ncbi:MAG: endolytic transglycosylase MltG [bacterium]|nr:endolytic transglycosylase MltG [bacterium]
MKNKIIIPILILFVLAMLWLPYYSYMLSPVMDLNTQAEIQAFSIAKGAGLDDIALSLEEKNLVRSASIFKLYAFLKGRAHQLKPGLYKISRNNSVAKLVDIFTEGPNNEVDILVSEGKTLDQIDQNLADFGILKRGELKNFPVEELRGDYKFLKGKSSLEGFLFPDTYRIDLSSEPEQILRKILNNFEKKALPVIEFSGKDLYETLIIASMLEKEIPDSIDRQIVSGIIQNRLEIGQALQIDATLIYAKDNGDAYDTYKNPGLPPTPIANPGLDAIKAAIAPTNTDYYYYLSNPETTETLFSKTFDEHDTKRAQYLR